MHTFLDGFIYNLCVRSPLFGFLNEFRVWFVFVRVFFNKSFCLAIRSYKFAYGNISDGKRCYFTT